MWLDTPPSPRNSVSVVNHPLSIAEQLDRLGALWGAA